MKTNFTKTQKQLLKQLKKGVLTVLLFLFATSVKAQVPTCSALHFELPGANPDSIHFLYIGLPMTHYAWDFGDGTTASTAYPWHYYSTPGVYYACLTVTDSTAGGVCTDTQCDSIHISGNGVACNPRFINFAAGANQENVTFLYIGSAATSFLWNFGDGDTSSTRNPAHTYTAPGTYFVCVTITDSTANGTCTATTCDSVVVTNAPPTCNPRDFHFATTNPDSIRFFYFGSQATSYSWDFGDGGTSTLQNPTHTYAGTGNYVACVTITDSTSGGTCTGTFCDTVHIVNPPPVCNPHFVHNIVAGNQDSIHFNYNGSAATSYAWTFGDGATSTLQNPSHLYTTGGWMHICVTITTTNSGGTCTGTFCDSIHIVIPPPVCNAHYTNNTIGIDSIQFNYNGTAATSYAWTFGDGGTSTAQNPLHVYAQGGNYHVCVTITKTNGGGTCTDNYCKNIHIAVTPPVCAAHFVHNNTSNLDSISFTYNGSTALTYTWHFGDASAVSHAQNPSHVYATSGVYYACVTITDSTNGGTCSNTWCDSVHVLAAVPVCDAQFQYFSLNNPDSVHFFPLSTAANTYTWDFGDGNSSTQSVPWHEYATGGAYYVCLTVTDSTGGGTCSNTWCDTVHIPFPAPVCNAQFNHYALNTPDSVQFFPLSTSPKTYSWTFGDGDTSTSATPWHDYATSGIYTVCLTVTDSTAGGTCSDTFCDTLNIVIPPPVCDASFGNYSLVNNPDSVQFYPLSTSAATYTWDFGDGNSSTNATPWNLYSAPGIYIACLTVTDSTNGGTCTNTVCDSINIPYPAPICSPQYAHIAINNADSIQFLYSGSTALTYSWDFGDASALDTAQNPIHIYAPGFYTACVTITDSTLGGSCTNTFCDTLTVIALPPVCDAHFSHVSASTDSIYFYPLSTAANTYTWDFGDGNSSTSPTSWHQYAVDGIYNVCLTVTDSNSGGTCTSTWCDTVHVGAAPVCDGHFTHLASATNQDSITFTPVNTAAISYLWDFGDGSSNSTTVSPLHVFTALGTYTVCLTITDTSFGGTCTLKWCDTIHITSLTGLASYMQANAGVKIYPNPMNEFATVTLSNVGTKASFSIYDVDGRIIYRNENLHDGNFRIDTKNIVSGIYFYSVNDDKQLISKGKIVIAH